MNRSLTAFFLIIGFLAHSQDDTYLEAEVYELIFQAESQLYQAQFDSAFALSGLAYQKAMELGDEELQLRVLNERGSMLNVSGVYDSAMSIHLGTLGKVGNDTSRLYFETQYHIGVTKFFISEIATARKHILEAYGYFLKDRDTNTKYLGRAMTLLGVISFLEGKPNIAVDYIEESNRVLEGSRYETILGANHSFYANLLFWQGKYAEAIAGYQKALSFYESRGRLLNKANIYIGLAQVYERLGEPQKAFDNAQLAAQIDPRLNTPDAQAQVYKYLSEVYGQKGEYRIALDYFRQAAELESGLMVNSKRISIAQMEREYNMRAQELSLRLLEHELAIQRQGNENKKMWIFITIIISVYLLVFVIVYQRMIRQKNKAQEILRGKKDELERKNTQIAKTQDRLVKSEKMALLGRLSAGLGHELNTPISAIKANIDLIQNLQRKEIERFAKFATDTTPEILRCMITLIVKADSLKDEVISTQDRRKISRTIGLYFENLDINNKDQVIDILSELRISDDIYRYDPVYKSEHAVDILEFVLYVINRSQAACTAKDALERVLRILSSFKTYSFKRGWENVESFDLIKNIETILNLHQGSLGHVEIIREFNGEITMLGIPDELSQVWSNIITNAAYVMPNGGTLTIRVSREVNRVRVEIEDTGGGVNTDSDIFEPFFTTKPEGEGAGLGLDITKQIIQKHNGSIDFHNTGKGVVFVVLLPIDNPEVS